MGKKKKKKRTKVAQRKKDLGTDLIEIHSTKVNPDVETKSSLNSFKRKSS